MDLPSPAPTSLYDHRKLSINSAAMLRELVAKAAPHVPTPLCPVLGNRTPEFSWRTATWPKTEFL